MHKYLYIVQPYWHLLLERIKQHPRRWIGGFGAGILCIGLLIYISGTGSNKNTQTPTVSISIASVERKDVPFILNEVGTVTAYETVTLRSRLDSQVMEVKFRDGDMVRKGDLLFVLDDRTLKAQLTELEANVARDKAQLQNLQRQYERSKALTGKGFESRANLDDAKAAFEAQRANVGATEAALENSRVQLGYTRITAPIDGRTGTINVTTGNTVKANDTQSLVTINQIQPIRVQATLSQSYFDAVRKAMTAGQHITVTASRENSDDHSEGVMEYLDNTVNQSTGTFVVRAVFPNKDEHLWPGMFVNLTMKLGEEKQALVIPEVAVQHGQNGDYVFVITENKAQKRPVKIARLQNNLAIISEGLKEKEQIATDGILQLKEGSITTNKIQ